MSQPDYQDMYERLCQRAPLALHALKSAILRAEELLAQAQQHAAEFTKQPGWEKLTEDEQKRAMEGAHARIDNAKKALSDAKKEHARLKETIRDDPASD